MSLLTTLGLLIIAAPLLLIVGSPTPRRTAVTLIVTLYALHLAIALLTLSFGIAAYPTILGAYVFTLCAGAVLLRRQIITAFLVITSPPRSLKRFRGFDTMLLAVIVITLLALGSVHYRYTGLISTATQAGYQRVENVSITYPYYADEWYAVGFIKDSLATGHLPLRHPLTAEHQPFPNFEAAFHSLLAELTILLDLDPLTHYTAVSVGINTLTIIMLYLLLREHRVGPTPAAAAALGALYITNSANLPGLWTLIPLTAALPPLLATLFFISRHQEPQYKTALAAGLTLLLYPPLVVVLAPALLATLIQHQPRRRAKLLAGAAGLTLLCAAIVAAFYVVGRPADHAGAAAFFTHTLTTAIQYETFTPNAIPRYLPHHVVPWLLLAAAVLGIIVLSQRRAWWLLAPLTVGTLYWLAYSRLTERLIIEQQRIILVTSLLFITAAGFGLNACWQLLQRKVHSHPYRQAIMLVMSAAVPALFLLLLPTYTGRTTWQHLVLVDQTSGETLRPAAPANRYLTDEDLALFQNLGPVRFLSLPWKGTTLGVATSAIPASIKPGTITWRAQLADAFLARSCPQKQQLARQHALDYVYLPSFTCPGFIPQATSDEGLTLYKVENRKEKREKSTSCAIPVFHFLFSVF